MTDSDLRSRAADLLAALRVYPKDGRLVLDAMETLDAALRATDVPSVGLDVDRLADALLNERDREVIEGPSYPKGWRGRAERLAAEYERLAALRATDVPSTPVDALPPLDVDSFLAGLDSPNHNDDSRRAWVALFWRDMKVAASDGLREWLAEREPNRGTDNGADNDRQDGWNAGWSAAREQVRRLLAKRATDVPSDGLRCDPARHKYDTCPWGDDFICGDCPHFAATPAPVERTLDVEALAEGLSESEGWPLSEARVIATRAAREYAAIIEERSRE